MSEVHQDLPDLPDEKPSAPFSSHKAVAAPRRPARVPTLILRGLAVAAISAAVGAAVALIAFPPGVGRQLGVPLYAIAQPTINTPAQQVSANVSPTEVPVHAE